MPIFPTEHQQVDLTTNRFFGGDPSGCLSEAGCPLFQATENVARKVYGCLFWAGGGVPA